VESWITTKHGVGKKMVLFKKTFQNTPIIEVALSRVSIGEGIEMHEHESKSESYFFIDGKAEMNIGQECLFFKKDDFIIVPPKTLHSIKNIGDVDLCFLMHHIEEPTFKKDNGKLL